MGLRFPARRVVVGLTVVVLLAGCAAASGPTGSMADGRSDHTATLLADGSVLVAGGWDLGGLRDSAEIYDPKSGTFSPTGSMAAARYAHTATLLPDGRVLFSGTAMNWPSDPEIYDPKSGTFSPTGSIDSRISHTATLLPDGRVLFAGGYGSEGTFATAEIYDPKSGTFSPTGSMADFRVRHTATVLADGRVLVAGGERWGYSSRPSLATAEIYDPKSGTFSPTGSMADARFAHTATLLPGSLVLVAGGADRPGIDTTHSLASAEIYDPKSGTFSPTGSMADARYAHTATLLPDGRVLVAGGVVTSWGSLATAEIYDPRSGTFSPTGP